VLALLDCDNRAVARGAAAAIGAFLMRWRPDTRAGVTEHAACTSGATDAARHQRSRRRIVRIHRSAAIELSAPKTGVSVAS
jgi:hypothetical protein